MRYLHPLSKVFFLALISFTVALILTPLISYFLYKFNIRQKIREASVDGKSSPVFSSIHKKKADTPTMGGVIIWISVLLVTVFLNLSRSQTWLPLFTLVATGILGIFDDIFNVLGIGMHRGIRAFRKLLFQISIAAVGAWWFFFKLGFDVIHIPAIGDFSIGWLYIILFIFVIVSFTNAVNVTDGLDGLAGGLLVIAFGAFAVIAFVKGRIELAAFCGTILGALLAFLWFNIYPARFFMGDTGSMALGATLGVVAMLLNSVAVLPIIGFVFVVEIFSSLVQMVSKKFFGKRVFISAPLHHHLEAKGWPEPKITMRLWIIAAVVGSVGLVIGLIGMGMG